MTSIRVTPARLRILRAIFDGKIRRYYPLGGRTGPYCVLRDGVIHQRVTGMVNTLVGLGLAEIGSPVSDSYLAPRTVVLTTRGREQYEKAEGKAKLGET